MTQLVRFDTTALNRALVGFDSIFNDFEGRFANQLHTSYPPYNILKLNEDRYEIQIAVAGFSKDEVELTVQNNHLIVKGSKAANEDYVGDYLHKGLAARDFERSFRLEGYLEVKSADVKDGVLYIKLERNIPEEKKPRRIAITAS